ncbi:terminase large subunit [Bacillus phage PBC5]|nr:terminase large subunit [Bacillus phage PBC5]
MARKRTNVERAAERFIGEEARLKIVNKNNEIRNTKKPEEIVPFSMNQLRALALSTAPFNLWDGSIRSGKTFLSMAWVAQMNQTLPKGDGMMLAQTPQTLERNFLNQFMEILGEGNYKYKTMEYIDIFYYKNNKRLKRRWHIVGAKDVGAVKRIRGSTLMIAYIDEASLMPEVVFEELVGRLSSKHAKLLATTNPDSPNHWLLKQYVENEEAKDDWRRFSFLLEDNLSLDEEYIVRIKRQYRGLPARYKRMILGLWVIAEGIIYQAFDQDRHVKTTAEIEAKYGKPRRSFIGCDYGVENATVFLLINEYRWKGKAYYHIAKEYYYSGRESMRTKTTSEFGKDFAKFCQGHRITHVIIDPSAAALKTEIDQNSIKREAGSFYLVQNASNEVIEGIQTVANLYADDALTIDPTCTNLIRENMSYSWDAKAQEKGEDKPVKVDDHCQDAKRYGMHTMKKLNIA